MTIFIYQLMSQKILNCIFVTPKRFNDVRDSSFVNLNDLYVLNRSCSFLVTLHCVQWWGALDQLWLRAAWFVRVCSTTGYNTSGIRGPSPQALILFRGVGFIARRLRNPEKGNADESRGIFGTACRVGLRACDRTHPKMALCHILTLVGRRINTVRWSVSLGFMVKQFFLII